ncbi:MAG: LUD domain-containing protein, partial [Chitinophagaceae bacterium]|nr:LUD domain-containing protein [Chitinophagaceae bacterium]
MMTTASSFIARTKSKAIDLDHRQKINFNIGRYNAAVPKGKQQYSNLEAARKKAKVLRWQAIEHLDQSLLQFEENFTARGGKVIWATDAQQALDAILTICREAACTTLVKSKSMVTEEIHLNNFLEQNGIESIETDLGEYIQQLDGESPYHIVTPAMHK